jgi:hypothetical protein
MLDNFRVDPAAMLRDMEHIGDQHYRRLINAAHQTELVEPLVEIIFNLGYLIAIWTIVVMMARRQHVVAPENRAVAQRVMWAFALLALGDTGHVGFRVLAYSLGGLEAQPVVLGVPLS